MVAIWKGDKCEKEVDREIWKKIWMKNKGAPQVDTENSLEFHPIEPTQLPFLSGTRCNPRCWV